MNTGFLSPTTIIQNAQGVNSWSNPNNILIPNGQFAVSTGSTNILTLGNFNFNVGQDNLISNFTVRVKGYRGSFNTTLQIIAIDDTSGVELAYPLTPFQGFSGSNTLYTLASSTFNTSWTVDQANNLKLRLIADGELYLDNIQIECSFVAINPVVPPTPTLGDLVVDEFVQGQRFQLAQSMTASDLFCFVQSFNFPNGSPIQITDFYGNALIVVDQGKAGLEENIRITNIEHNYNGSGLVRLSFTEIQNRGLDFAYPYTHDITLCRAHTGTAEVVISNSAPFYDRFLKKNQADVLFSIPIEVKANGSIVTSHVHGFNFVGAGVVITPDGVDPDKVIVTIAGAQNATPVPVSTSTATSGTTAVPSLTWQHATSGIDRLLRVLVSTDATTAVSSVTYNAVALTLNQTVTNGVVRLREYFLLAPPVGTYDIVVTVSPNSVITAGAESYVLVNQSSSIGVVDTDTGNSNNPTVTINTATDYSVIVDGIATAQTPIAYVTGSAQQVANYTVTPNTSSRQLGSSYQKAGTSPDAVVMDWTITQITDWVHLATEIKGTPVTITSSDEKVKISATDTTAGYLSDKITAGAGVTLTVLNPGANEEIEISAPGAGSSLEVEENGVSVETGVTKINILSNSPIVTNPATGEVEIDLTNIGGGGGSSKFYTFDDFTASHIVTNATASDFRYASGNFFFDLLAQNISEEDHPGVIVVDNTSVGLSGFISNTGGGTGDRLARFFDADFDVILNSRINYGGSLSRAGAITIQGANGNEVSISVDLTASSNYSYSINGTPTTSSEPILASGTYAKYRFLYEAGVLTIFVNNTVLFTGAVSFNNATTDARATSINVGRTGANTGTFEIATDWVKTYSALNPVINGGGGNIINLTAGEDLAAGDTVGYASFIDDTAMKAVWAYRLNSLTGLAYTVSGVRAVCEIDTDKYAILFETSEAGTNVPYRIVIGTLDRDTLTWSFGTPTSIAKRPASLGVALCKVDTNKFIFSFLNDNVPAGLGVRVGSVSGTSITLGTEVGYVSPDIGRLTDMTQLAAGRVALFISTGGYSSQREVLMEITVSGTVPTLNTASLISGITDGIGLVQKIATDKVAIITGNSVLVATVSAGTWTVGTPVTLPSSITTSQLYGQISINSKDTNEFWVVADRGTDVHYLHYTVSGTTPTLNASGSYTDANNRICSLMTDGTDMFLFTQSTTASLSGVAKLTVSGANIIRSPFAVTYDAGGTFNDAGSHVKNMMINATGYYGQLSKDNPSSALDVLYHIKGMTNLFTGIAQSTVSKGTIVPVLIAGVDTNQSGLTAGALYDAFKGGVVATSTQLFNTMQAQNSTDLKI